MTPRPAVARKRTKTTIGRSEAWPKTLLATSGFSTTRRSAERRRLRRQAGSSKSATSFWTGARSASNRRTPSVCSSRNPKKRPEVQRKKKNRPNPLQNPRKNLQKNRRSRNHLLHPHQRRPQPRRRPQSKLKSTWCRRSGRQRTPSRASAVTIRCSSETHRRPPARKRRRESRCCCGKVC
uniref:(northern house mosquito) hypothetical protein n=1 Tax=Culex pipiens TaxID=7175 RepID=A0A8D8BIN3_CULPI